MNILNDIKKQKGCFVNVENQNNLVNAVNRLRKTVFDPKQFCVQNRSDGIFVFLRNVSDATTTSNVSGYHLSGEVTQSNAAGAGATMVVHGGIACRKTNSNVYAVPLTCDSAPSEFYEDYKTISGITTSRYVYAEFDDPLIPTALTIGTNATYPVDDANKYTKFVLGYANVTSDVLTWEPYREMDLIPDAPVIPDTNMPAPVKNRSVEFLAADGRLQLYGISNAASKMVVGVEPNSNGVDIVYRSTNMAAQTCGTGPSLAGTDVTISNTGHVHHIDSADFATSANSCSHATWADYANSASATHSLLTDIVAQTNASDDHGPGFTNYVLLSKVGDAARNKCDLGLSDSSGKWSVKTTDRALMRWDGLAENICASWSDNKWWGYRFGGDGLGHQGYCSLSFNDRCAYSGVGDYYKTIDWNLGYLYDGSAVDGNITLKWTTGKLSYFAWEAENSSDITAETYSGGFLIAGGATCKKTFQADRFTILDDNDNYWTANVFSAVVTDDIILNSPVIHYGNTAAVGITLANWTKVGGLIGANVVAQTIYANTGGSMVEMEVLARIL